MAVPTLAEAEQFLAEAEQLNPGAWVRHSRHAAQAAELIAARLPALPVPPSGWYTARVSFMDRAPAGVLGLDPAKARILGLLHDIGRRFGVTDMRHALDGYRFLAERGFEEAGRACLTHSFPIPDARSGSSAWDGSVEEFSFVQGYLDRIHYNDYDRLVQLCDALALPSGYCLIEKRLLDVSLRYGFNAYTIAKWKAILHIQRDFEERIGQSIYDLLPGVVENTFAARIV